MPRINYYAETWFISMKNVSIYSTYCLKKHIQIVKEKIVEQCMHYVLSYR